MESYREDRIDELLRESEDCRQTNPTHALALAQQALGLTRSAKSTLEAARCEKQVGLVCLTLGDHEQADEYLRKAYRRFEDLGEYKHQGDTALGRLELSMKQNIPPSQARTQLGDVKEAYRNAGYLGGVVSSMMSFVSYCIEHKDVEQAIACFHDALRLAKKSPYHGTSGRVVSEIITYLEAIEYHQSCKYLESTLLVANEVSDIVLERQIHEHLLIKRICIADVEHALIHARHLARMAKEELKQENLRLRIQLDQSEENRLSVALALGEREELISQLKKDVRGIISAIEYSKCDDKIKQRMYELGRKLDRKVTGHSWQQSLALVNRQYPNFIVNLRRVCPNVTEREEAICSLLLMGKTTKQMAEILGYPDVRQVEKHRLHIRNKLGLKDKDKSRSAIKHRLLSIAESSDNRTSISDAGGDGLSQYILTHNNSGLTEQDVDFCILTIRNRSDKQIAGELEITLEDVAGIRREVCWKMGLSGSSASDLKSALEELSLSGKA